MENVEALEKTLGYDFERKEYARQALRHPNIHGLNNSRSETTNDGLAVLGDAVLRLAVCTRFWTPEASKEDVSEHSKPWLTNSHLAAVARDRKLIPLLVQGGSFNEAPQTSVAQLLEAVLGATYLDGGYAAAERIINQFILPLAPPSPS